MAITTALCLALLWSGLCAAAQKETALPVFACNPKAISARDRPRYNSLFKRLRAAFTERSELPNGYSFKLDEKGITLSEAAEWISMERLCCPFLTFGEAATRS